MHILLWILGIYLALGFILYLIMRFWAGRRYNYSGKLPKVIWQFLIDIIILPPCTFIFLFFLLSQWFIDVRGGYEDGNTFNDDFDEKPKV